MRFLPNRSPYGGQDSFSPLTDPRSYSGIYPDLSPSLIHHHTLSFLLGRAWVTPLIQTFVSDWCKRSLALLWKLQSMKYRAHAEWGVVVPWGQVTLGWRCGWTKLICREMCCHSCWFSRKTSPISFGWQLLCDLSATWYHQLPIPARITAEPALTFISPFLVCTQGCRLCCMGNHCGLHFVHANCIPSYNFCTNFCWNVHSLTS